MFKDYYIPQHKMKASTLRNIRTIVRKSQKEKKKFDFTQKGVARFVRTLKLIERRNLSFMKKMAKEVEWLDAHGDELDFIPEYPPFYSIPQYLIFKLSCVTSRPWRPYYYD